jgi:cytochrome c oxidase cbb3-type subunit 4
MSENHYFIYTALLILLFIDILFWAFGKKRKKRFEDDGEIPFQDKQ